MFSNYNNKHKLESQPAHKRVFAGKHYEDLIVKALESQGLKFEKVTLEQDCDEKIDRYLVDGDTKKSVQIKRRMDYSGRDLLLDIYEPYFGLESESTKKGRDLVSNYDLYVCMARDIIYIVNGPRQKEIVNEVLEEWKSHGQVLRVYPSSLYPGIEIRYTSDKANHRPKLLMFIPPTTYSEEKGEVKSYPMIWPVDDK